MDIFKNKVKTTKQLYEKLHKYIEVIPDFSAIKLQDIISNINKNFTQLESNKNHNAVKFIFSSWNLINETLYLIKSILFNLELVAENYEKRFFDGVSENDIDRINEIHGNIDFIYKKFQKDELDNDIKTLNESVNLIKTELKWTNQNTKENTIKMTDMVKEFPHSVSLYTYLLQTVINTCLSSAGICDFIINQIESAKDCIILYNIKNQNGKKTLFQTNPNLKTFGLTPSDDAAELKVVTKKVFGESVNVVSGLSGLAKKNNTCIVVINHIIKNPLEFNIWKLIDKNIAQPYIQNLDMGITKKTIERFNTISYKPLEKGKKWNFDINYYGDINSEEFVVFVNMNYKLFRTYSIYDEMPIVGGGKREIKIKRNKIESFIEYVKNDGVMKTSTRVSEYHKIHERIIMNNMFIPVKFNVTGIKNNSQIIDSKFLRYEIFLRLIEQIGKIITKDFKNGAKILTYKDIGTIAHSPQLVDVFNSILIEQYDIYAIKNREHDSKFPFSETLQTFLSVLYNMNTDFRRLMHDYYVRTKIDEKLLSEANDLKKLHLVEIFKEIIKNALVKIISDERNIYQGLIYKNSLLKLSLV
jgi:hypothetical protein